MVVNTELQLEELELVELDRDMLVALNAGMEMVDVGMVSEVWQRVDLRLLKLMRGE
jgi:hypothetical protein